jgi:anti-anti-sigma factor
VEVLVVDGRSALALHGDLDLGALPTVREALLGAAADPQSDLVVDFRDVSFCGAAVLGLLAATSARLRERGFRLLVCRARPAQSRIFHLCALDYLLA